MIQFQVMGDFIVIAGDTYPVKDQIKAMGGRFDWQEKYWKLPHTETNLKNIEELCSSPSPAPTNQDEQPVQPIQPKQPEIDIRQPAGKDTYTVSQISGLVSRAVERALPNYIWVTGEVQNLSRKSSGRGTAIYLSLAEPKETSSRGGAYSLQAAVWADRYTSIEKKHGIDATKAVFAEGLKVRMRCKVTIYKDRGQVSLQVSDIDPAFTQGALALARQKTLAELRRLGIDRKQKSLSFDPWADAIGLVTAEKSRAYGDFADQYFSGKGLHAVYFHPAASQGEATRGSIIAGIKALEAKGVSAIVITRGGGSASDLRWFDDLELCKAICNASVPVFAAIGHHDDVCVAEEICYLRQKTPTAAAAFFVQNTEKLRTKVNQQKTDLRELVDKTFSNHTQKLAGQKSFFAKYSRSVLELIQLRLAQTSQNIYLYARQNLQRKKQTIGEIRLRLRQASMEQVQHEQLALGKIRTRLAEVDPGPWLQKGWALLASKTRKLGRPPDIDQIKPGDKLKAHIAGGSLELTVDATQKD